MNKLITAAAAALCLMTAACPVLAEEAAGDWAGVLGKDLKIALHLKKDGKGQYEGHMKSVEQGGAIIPLDNINATPDTLSFHGANARLGVDGRYEGRWDEAKTQWTGTWFQGGSVELNFKRTGAAAEAVPKRPQEEAIAKGALPYRNEEVTFDNPAAPGVRLAGTFSKPKGKGPFPAVVLISGSGQNTRDEEGYGHKHFLVLADALNRAGIATLRYDKRGVSQSSGDYNAATTFDFASDARAATAFLKGRADVDTKHIGVIGHSEGGLIAPMVATESSDVAYVVILSGLAIRGDRDMLRQAELMSEAEGQPRNQIAAKLALYQRAYAIVVASTSREQAVTQLNALADAAVAAGQIDRKTADEQIATITNPWNYASLRYDPAEMLSKVNVPVLALYGSLDMQTPPAENIAALRTAFAGKPDVTIVEMPGINHQLQTARTGGRSEYKLIEETIAPVVLKTVSDWVVAHTR